ncbi:MAG: NADH dehydrogenase [ubiquinone] 1 alpha subcomplex assembly factor 1 [Candidatus Binatia bacterium]|jgi:NADH dehydrogenase [ubiquinone] 1 alpha subcomplex assembly factor 1
MGNFRLGLEFHFMAAQSLTIGKTMIANRMISSGFLTPILLLSLAMTMNAEPPTNHFVFKFETGNPLSQWQVVNDGVMGGLSTSQFRITSQKTALFSGVVSLKNNGGFASVRSIPLRDSPNDRDAIKIRVRGDGKRYSFTVRGASGFRAPSYQCAFTTRPGEWLEIELLFEDFKPSWRGRSLRGQPSLKPSKGDSLGLIISDKQAGAFQLEIAWIKFTKATLVAPKSD